jgi:periplasmic divalent cation tolerance protein
MAERDDPIRLIYTTFASAQDAETCGGALVEQGVAACVNILPEMVSVYAWQGEIRRDREAVMIVKTRAGRLADTLSALEQTHPYETPALIVLTPESVNAPYADWLRQQTGAD